MNRLFSDLAALSARTDSAEKRIHARALDRDGEIMARMKELRPSVMVDEGAADEYRSLALERGTVANVIGLARERMGNGIHDERRRSASGANSSAGSQRK